MRVLLINPNCTTGGIETFMHALAASLDSQGIDVSCFFYYDDGQFATFAQRYPSYLGTEAPLAEVLGRERHDVIHANAAAICLGLVDDVRRRAWKGRLIVTSHDWVYPGWDSRTCFAYVTVNSELARETEPCTDLEADVIHNGIDTERFTPAPLESAVAPIVAWVGRGGDLPQKRIDKLAAIAPALHQARVRLWIADPDGPDHIDPQAARVLRPLAEVWRRIPFAEMPRFYQEVSASGGCVLSTSSFEGHSVALLEAQASGCPVIAPDVRGIREGVSAAHGGILFPFEIDPTGLARWIIQTLGNKAGMQQRRQACRAYIVEQFSMARMARDYLDLYTRRAQRRQPNADGSIARRNRADQLLRFAEGIYQTDIRRACWALRAAIGCRPSLQWRPAIQFQRLWFWAKHRRYLAWAARRRAEDLNAQPRRCVLEDPPCVSGNIAQS